MHNQSTMRPIMVVLTLITVAIQANASWFSDIIGINIDLAKGRVEIGRPNLNAIPQMLQNLPKDAAQFFLNPGGNVLGFAIRQAKGQAQYGCRPIPSHVVQALSAFVPPQFYAGVCWNVHSPGRITLDRLLLNHLGNGAVTLEDVIVFQNDQLAMDVPLWAHELMHVQQYRRLGLETFAHIYMYNFNSMESEAYQFQNFVAARYRQQPTQPLYTTYPQAFGGPIPMQAYRAAAQQFIPAATCAIWQDQPGALFVRNPCPVPIVLTGFQAVHLPTRQVGTFPCQGDCLVPPGGTKGFPRNGPVATQQVFFRY